MKAHDICVQIAKQNGKPFGGDAFIAIMQMARWKDEQMKVFYRNELLKLNTYICKLFQVDDFIDVEQSVKELEKLNSNESKD